MEHTVYFERSNGEFIPVGGVRGPEFKARDASFDLIERFCFDHKYKIPYWRLYNDTANGVPMTCVDVGSHTELFWIEPPLEDFTKGGSYDT